LQDRLAGGVLAGFGPSRRSKRGSKERHVSPEAAIVGGAAFGSDPGLPRLSQAAAVYLDGAPIRIENDCNGRKYLGVITPFDIKAVCTCAVLDPPLKMVDVPEMKFQPKLPGQFP
jgi:hypothetical protein